MRHIVYFSILISLLSCSIGGDIEDYDQSSVYEYSIKSSKLKKLKSFGINENTPFIRYFNNSSKIVIAQYYTFYIINENGSEVRIETDSILINDDGYFDISPDNENLIFGGTITKYSPNTGHEYINKGLYILNILNKNIYPFHLDSMGIARMPVYSHTGDKILFKVYKKQMDNFLGSSLNIIDVEGKNNQTIASSEYDGIKYGFWSKNDKMIFYVNSGVQINSYNTVTNQNSELITGYYLKNGILMDEYPILGLTDTSLIFYASENKEACSENFIYSYNFDNEKIIKLSSGILPMSISENYFLYREDICGFERPSLLILKKNSEEYYISQGNYAIISDNEESVLFVWDETKKY